MLWDRLPTGACCSDWPQPQSGVVMVQPLLVLNGSCPWTVHVGQLCHTPDCTGQATVQAAREGDRQAALEVITGTIVSKMLFTSM